MKTINIYGTNYNGTPSKIREVCRGIIVKNNNICISFETNTD